MRWPAAVVILVIVIAAGAAAYVYSGAYDVAATSPHTAPVAWLLDTTMDRSVDARARSISVPALNAPGMIDTGVDHYHEMCVTCHGAPGVKPDELADGLYPAPPALASEALPPANQIFWIVKNGIKMTGMPAFGPTHTDQQIWAITAFVEQLPGMSPGRYQQLVRQATAGGDHDDGAGHHDTGAPQHGDEPHDQHTPAGHD